MEKEIIKLGKVWATKQEDGTFLFTLKRKRKMFEATGILEHNGDHVIYGVDRVQDYVIICKELESMASEIYEPLDQ